MTQDEIIRMAREAGFNSDEFDNAGCPCEECNWLRPMIERFAALVAAHEREACAKEADYYAKNSTTARNIAAAIRARGKNASS